MPGPVESVQAAFARRPRVEPHLALLRPASSDASVALPRTFRIATYNVHRWAGVRGGNAWHPERAAEVIASLDADVIALQEVLRPDEDDRQPLLDVVEKLGFHLAFAITRRHRRGELGNAILSRYPLASARVLNLSIGRLEQRAALVVELEGEGDRPGMAVVATHLALVDRTRRRQVQALLENPMFAGPVVLLGDMNAWRECRASRELDSAFLDEHHNLAWPPSFPAVRPVLALDRIYARDVTLRDLHVVSTDATRLASDHLPVAAQVLLNG